MAEVWFIRHGESLSNAGHVVKRTETTSLTATGHEQALRVSEAFTRAPDLVVVTPYLRTMLTAIPTLEKFPSARHEVWPLQEFSCLSRMTYSNTNQEQREPLVKAYWNRQDPGYIEGSGAESFNGMIARLMDGLSRLRAAHENFIAVFTHGYVIRTLRFLIEHPELSAEELIAIMPDYIERTEIENCAIVRATADANGICLHEEDRKVFHAGLSGVMPFPERQKKT